MSKQAGPEARSKIAKRHLASTLPAIIAGSAILNLLVLTGPLYMLQVYDRVIPARSTETLGALSLIMTLAFLAIILIEQARARIVTLVGARIQSDLDPILMSECLRRIMGDPGKVRMHEVQRDLETAARVTGTPAFLSIFDIPWIPLFLGATFLVHPMLGLVAMSGGGILVLIAILTAWATREKQEHAMASQIEAERTAREIRRDADLIRGLGMGMGLVRRWREAQKRSILSWVNHADAAGGFSAISKNLRLLLQSIILGVGAWLVIHDEMSSGGMIASSVLIGRALAPIDALIGGWAGLQKARASWGRLKDLLETAPQPSNRTALPRPTGRLTLEQVSLGFAGRAILRGISFDLRPGGGLGIIGSSGSGKTTLGRVIAGILPPQMGRVLLDGAPIEHYDAGEAGSWIGYLPQDVRLMRGTIEENIARFAEGDRTADVVRAARLAGVHELILSLPQGYQTAFEPEAPALSGGQIQRIGIARAIFGTPPVIILDEPNSNLDHEGSEALTRAVQGMRALGSSVIVITHRPNALAGCDHLLVLENGMVRGLGPKDQIMAQTTTPPATAPAQIQEIRN